MFSFIKYLLPANTISYIRKDGDKLSYKNGRKPPAGYFVKEITDLFGISIKYITKGFDKYEFN